MFVESVYYWVDKYVNERESLSLPENQASETMAKKNPENLIAELVPSRPNEVWVSDITYVETGGGAHAVRDAAQMLEKRMGGDVE